MSLAQRKEPYALRRVRPHTPLKAKRLLATLNVRQYQLAASVELANGEHPTESVISQLMNRNLWPANTPKVWLEQQIAAFLREHGAREVDIEMAFETEDDGRSSPRPTRQDHARTGSANAPIEDENPLPEREMLTQTARRHFALFRDPFQEDVQGPDDVFLAPDQRYIREYMFNTAQQGGFLAVIGEVGAGKSVLRRDLLDRIRRDGHAITPIMPRIIDKERLTAGAICDAIIEDISQEKPRRSLEAKGRQVERLLTGSSRSGASHVLVIEEAHDLSVQTLKYLKRFWELEDGFRRLLAIILIGQPELHAKLDEHKNPGAREVIRRIEVADIGPLDDHLEDYLAFKLKRLKKAPDEIFDADAYAAMRERMQLRLRATGERVSMLYPLSVNALVISGMNLAAKLGERRVNAEVIKSTQL